MELTRQPWQMSHREARVQTTGATSLLRGPGHTLREQLEEESSNIIWDVLVLAVAPLMMLACFHF